MLGLRLIDSTRNLKAFDELPDEGAEERVVAVRVLSLDAVVPCVFFHAAMGIYTVVVTVLNERMDIVSRVVVLEIDGTLGGFIFNADGEGVTQCRHVSVEIPCKKEQCILSASTAINPSPRVTAPCVPASLSGDPHCLPVRYT